MDESVIQSMARWPDVPDVYGWLALDRRGNWLVKGTARGFGRISNAAVNDFIGRNYQHDDAGRWFFQNGPQRVFVTLHYMPLVYRLGGDGGTLCDHTGRDAHALLAAWLDDAGGLVLETNLGFGSMDDRDLDGALACMTDGDGEISDDGLLAPGKGLSFTIGGDRVDIGAIAASGVASKFGFDPQPRPPAGQPDC
jgi:hypothetical protein